MANNTINRTNNNTNIETWPPLPQSSCIPWLVVFITECLAIIIPNIITVNIFLKKRQLQRRSAILIIHLAIIDFLVGAVSGPLEIYRIGSVCKLWKYSRNYAATNSIANTFTLASLVNLAAISLERVHATFCPFKHRFIEKWVYGVIMIVTWITSTIVALTRKFILGSNIKVRRIFEFSAFFVLLFIISVSYISIFIKIHFIRRPQHHSAAGVREKKLTSTLLIVTLGSFLAWFPLVILQLFSIFSPQFYLNFPLCYRFHIGEITRVSYTANSVLNPIIYAMRMPEVRQGLKQILFHKTSNRLNQIDLPVRNR
ncbi:melanocortin receptor 4-like [Stylophora pistillata]|uniref:melanocortin receptor 4-like n=1 Tax=Stylophora pistillata TaxID=50429 RepID=UPI000C03E945|nr:melanocortin receptor 4-like [Stylophora pistillata]